jgi:type I restriction enzyme S subunit
MDNYFVFYNLVHKNILFYIKGGTRSKLNQSELKKIQFPFPPLPEQRRIAEILSTIDETIERTEALIEKYRHIKAGLMSDLLTRGIDEEGRIRSEETHEYKDSPLGRVPEEWQIKTTKETLYMKGRIGWRGLKKSEFTKFGPYLITGMHFVNDKIDWTSCFHINMERYTESPEIHVKINDVLLTKDGTIGKVAFIDYLPAEASLNSHLLLLRPLKENLYSKFIFYILLSDSFKRFIDNIKSGSTLAGLSQSSFEKFKFIIPSNEEQHHIAEILTTTDTYIKKEQTYLNKLQQIKKGLMQDLLTGKVRVTTTPLPPKPAEAAT